ncbi:hypothetical protein PUR22_07595 [Mycolicibacterium porcinum]
MSPRGTAEPAPVLDGDPTRAARERKGKRAGTHTPVPTRAATGAAR